MGGTSRLADPEVEPGMPGATTGQTAHAPLVLNLDQVDASFLPSAGGKAANLGDLIQAGFPVPPGFVVTTSAYDRVVAENAISGLIPAATETGDGEAIRASFETSVMPPAVEEAIVIAYREMGSGSVAVRSSATAEDLPDAAFAGQQDSYLGIVDEPALLDAVRRCWGSLWSDRAIAYRAKHGFAGSEVKLAVVVQRLVAADCAGVMFTANPISGARNETVIDASTGLGEAIVSGLVTPDHIVLRKGRLGWRIVERQLGRHEVEIRALPGGGTEQTVGNVDAGPALSDAILRRLARLGAVIQRHLGRPQDIEWAWAGEKLFVLQSRPITVLPDAPAKRGPFQFPRGGPTEYFQMRPYPLDMTSWMPAMSAALMRMFPVGKAMPSFVNLWVEEDGVVTRFGDWPSMRLSPDLLLAPLRLIPLAWKYDPAHWKDDPVLATSLARMHRLDSQDPRSMTWDALLASAREALAIPYDVVELRRRYFPRAVLALGALRLLIGRLGYGHLFSELLSGVDNKTLEANRKLEELAAQIRADPALAELLLHRDPEELRGSLEQVPAGQGFLKVFDQFLTDYGHRETVSPLLISQPTWRDAPAVVFGILKGLALAEPGRRDGTPKWETARDEVLKHPMFEVGPLRQAFIALLTAARRFPDLREDTHFIMTRTMPALRQIFLEMGSRLTEIGVLASSDEIFHLRFEELQRLGGSWPPQADVREQLRSAVRDRAERRAALADSPLMPLPTTAAPIVGDALLAGTPGSPGLAKGPARLIRDAAAFGMLQPGDVLVAPYTNPSWTPLFGRAAAVIVDAGSAMSHAAIVAREYGVPAVMGTGDAMARLHDGQQVLVDGTRGLVFPADGVDGN